MGEMEIGGREGTAVPKKNIDIVIKNLKACMDCDILRNALSERLEFGGSFTTAAQPSLS